MSRLLPCLLGLAAFLAVLGALPATAGDKPPAAFMTVTFETPEGGAYAQEMVVMHVRSFFKARATLENLEQPALDDLGWMQLGHDDWAPTKVDTETYFGFERKLAVFAPEDGPYLIPPFTHHVTLIDPEGVRWKIDVRSEPVTLTIRKWPGKTNGPLDENIWWLPARGVEIKDSWSADPSDLAPGDTVRRQIDVSATGVQAEQLPPAIDTTTPGLVIFPGPVVRRTEVVDGVPVGHASYTFDVRPHTGGAVILPEVLVPWFDTKAREMRQAIVPGASVGRGMAGPGALTAEDADAVNGSTKALLGLAAASLAFFAGVAVLLLPGRRDREPALPRLRADWHRLARTGAVRLAALQGKGDAMRAAVYRLGRADASEGLDWLADPQAADVLRDLDRALFAEGPAPAPAALRTTAAQIFALRRAAIADAQTRAAVEERL